MATIVPVGIETDDEAVRAVVENEKKRHGATRIAAIVSIAAGVVMAVLELLNHFSLGVRLSGNDFFGLKAGVYFGIFGLLILLAGIAILALSLFSKKLIVEQRHARADAVRRNLAVRYLAANRSYLISPHRPGVVLQSTEPARKVSAKKGAAVKKAKTAKTAKTASFGLNYLPMIIILAGILFIVLEALNMEKLAVSTPEIKISDVTIGSYTGSLGILVFIVGIGLQVLFILKGIQAKNAGAASAAE